MHFQPASRAVKFTRLWRRVRRLFADFLAGRGNFTRRQATYHHTIMRSPLLLIVCLLAPLGFAAEVAPPLPRNPSGDPVYQARLADYGDAAYATQVEKLISAYETATGRRLVP